MVLRTMKVLWSASLLLAIVLSIFLSFLCVQAVLDWRAAENERIIEESVVKNGDHLSSKQFAQEYISLADKASEIEGVTRFFRYIPIRRKVKERKKNILIAVVTTEKYLWNRAVAINQTWAREIKENNQLYFFVGEDCNIDDIRLQGMPIVKMKGIKDHIYPPQKKVFAVLKYIYDTYGEQYKWFMRADDDVYIRISSLEATLQDLDWTERLFLGRPGWGKVEDRMRLKLLPHENYCMGGPGVVFSAVTMKILSPYLDKCLEGITMYNSRHHSDEKWYNEDVELGRCVSRTLGIRCTTLPLESEAWADDSYFVHVFDPRTLDLNALWTSIDLLNAISIHPLKSQDHMYRIHHFFKQRDYQTLSSALDRATLELKQLCSQLPGPLLPTKLHSEIKQFLKCYKYKDG